jgi:hypothetical protein
MRQLVWLAKVLAAEKASVCRRSSASVRGEACIPPEPISQSSRRSEMNVIERLGVWQQNTGRHFSPDKNRRTSARVTGIFSFATQRGLPVLTDLTEVPGCG